MAREGTKRMKLEDGESIFLCHPNQEGCWTYHEVPEDKVWELLDKADECFTRGELEGIAGNVQFKKINDNNYSVFFPCGPADRSNQPALEAIGNNLIEKLGPPRFPMHFCVGKKAKLSRDVHGIFKPIW